MKLSVPLALGLLLGALGVVGCSTTNPANPTSACTFTVGQASTSAFGPEGGTGTAAVTAGSGCSWTAVSNASFITISQGGSGTSNGTVQFTVAQNSAAADRSGTLTIAGSTITITQRAAGPTTPVTLSAPATVSPTGGQFITTPRPTLVVNNTVTTGNPGTVTYHFEVSDLSAFPNDPVRTFTADGVAQGSSGTTSWTLTRDLGPNVLWYWRARATNGSINSAFSNVDTFSTGTACTYTLSATTPTIGASGGVSTVTVTTASGCTWTATSNAPFITVTSGSSGTGTATVTFSVAASNGSARTGTLTIAGQTVTLTQQGANLSVGFQLFDPGRMPGATTECQIRSLTSAPTLCVLQSTSFPLGTNSITSYSWTVSYTYPSDKNLFQTGTNPQFSFTDLCGQLGSTDSGTQVFLSVTLTVTDTDGNTVTVKSNAASQPLLTLRAYICGV